MGGWTKTFRNRYKVFYVCNLFDKCVSPLMTISFPIMLTEVFMLIIASALLLQTLNKSCPKHCFCALPLCSSCSRAAGTVTAGTTLSNQSRLSSYLKAVGQRHGWYSGREQHGRQRHSVVSREKQWASQACY